MSEATLSPTLVAHTPGPWWIERRLGDELQVNAKHRGEGSSYCVASINHWEGEADRANARLIAAAPDLLAALRKAAAYIGNTPSFRIGHVGAMNLLAECTDAINKAMRHV